MIHQLSDSKHPEFWDLLSRLVRQPAVVGAERALLKCIRRELDSIGVGVQEFEGVLAAYGKKPDSGFISAHVDRHGLYCTGPDEYQYAAYSFRYAEARPDFARVSRIFESVKNRFVGAKVQAYEPWSGAYLGTGTVLDATLSTAFENIAFDISDLASLPPRTPIAFLDYLRIDGGDAVCQLDNILGVALLVYLFQKGYPGTGFFTVEEECGRSYRYLKGWFRRFKKQTDALLVLDTSPYRDRTERDTAGIVFRNRDEFAAFNAEFAGRLVAICKQQQWGYSFKDEYVAELNNKNALSGVAGVPQPLGRTELGRLIAATDGELSGTTLQIPTVGYHTNEEAASMNTIERAIDLLLSHY